MFEISFPVKHSEIDSVLNKLIAIGLDSTYYDAPYEVTVDSNGYGFYEKENDFTELKVYPSEDNKEQCLNYIEEIKDSVNVEGEIKLTEIREDDWQQPFEPVDLNNGWIIAEPEAEVSFEKGKINFESQGSFGTGLHETTQDFLRYILDEDFSGLKVLDLGTGSGILSIAAALKNAEHVTALDIRDVTEEVMYNAALNNITNIDIVINDVTSQESNVKENYDVVFINIGGDETLSCMDLINDVIKDDGKLFVSGLVEWSSDEIYKELNKMGYNLIKKTKTNEWVTMVLQKEIS
ncbi:MULTISPECIES: 50S ribosomal protein L11 methyltransferase [Clostridium]|uniref:Methyltransferase domain-containing protein n=2 Tax=Clostridium butyricum TaxID=1492 RepID=A0AAP9UG57_CLOBU|nr:MULTISPECIES: 50S ribosomal protein L11 methyltransferase [Clostridium]ALR90679.1 50S ribosomal protein L11 methyltransferase [Clostridium butyricum]ALS18915.1 50S ribosomal protein L11 methyltransferase [Clostridium butyricum]ANF16102.1 50S ribosomal protein L11 methyltransferase [Clostridium butyricum]AOR96014.1 50S ribosomal protein L11 methyltransferase [Clostridium butyricum]APF21203.1 ribosomal L11 methyltransferase family protein [Clostridium butyricum]